MLWVSVGLGVVWFGGTPEPWAESLDSFRGTWTRLREYGQECEGQVGNGTTGGQRLISFCVGSHSYG